MFISVLRLALSLLPAPVQIFVLGVIGLILILVVFKVVAFVLDAIPFL